MLRTFLFFTGKKKNRLACMQSCNFRSFVSTFRNLSVYIWDFVMTNDTTNLLWCTDEMFNVPTQIVKEIAVFECYPKFLARSTSPV